MFEEKHTSLVFFFFEISKLSFFLPAGGSGAPDSGVPAFLTHSNAKDWGGRKKDEGAAPWTHLQLGFCPEQSRVRGRSWW